MLGLIKRTVDKNLAKLRGRDYFARLLAKFKLKPIKSPSYFGHN